MGVALGRFGANGEGILDAAPPDALPAGILFVARATITLIPSSTPRSRPCSPRRERKAAKGEADEAAEQDPSEPDDNEAG